MMTWIWRIKTSPETLNQVFQLYGYKLLQCYQPNVRDNS